MRLIVAGSRWIPEGVALLIVDAMIRVHDLRPTVILCGKARGPDTAGETWAKQRGVKVGYYPALWGMYGNGAGPERNERMAIDGTDMVALWDGHSTGTADMITRARKRYGDLHVHIARLEPSPATAARLDEERRAKARARRKPRPRAADLAAAPAPA
jgi:hypothetical protein